MSNRYTHTYAECSVCQSSPIVGPLHFTRENERLSFWCKDCAKLPDILPKICVAIKAPIDNLVEKCAELVPNISHLNTFVEEGQKEFTCDFTKLRSSTEKASLYMSYTKLTESIDEFSLSEESYFQANSNDINPIIYLRIAKGYKPRALEGLPTFELSKYYKTLDHYGLRLTLSPDF